MTRNSHGSLKATNIPTDMIILVHIPKTGGTSLRHAAEQYFGASRMLYDYGALADQTSELVQEWVYGREDLQGFAQAATAQGFAFMSGHFPYSKYRTLFPGAAFVSWVRDPVARVRSEFLHLQRHMNFQGSFRDFYTQPRFQNRQFRDLGPEPGQLDFIGVMETFETSLAALNRQLGVELAPRHSNRAPAGQDSPISQADLAQVIALNQDDIRLYSQLATR